MGRTHEYKTRLRWTGNRGKGTASYPAYGREHVLSVEHKPDLLGSSDPHFRGDASRWNPEELLVAALSACHMLSYLHLCATHGVVVTEYEDSAEGTMELNETGGGRFTSVRLRPRVTIAEGDATLARTLHGVAHEHCFIASSMNFPVHHEPTIVNAAPAASATAALRPKE